MVRAQGFARGDFDTSFQLDDKFLAMRNALPAARYYAATGVYWHVVAAAWREVERKPAARICPDADQEIADLIEHRLLEADGRLKRRSFTAYIGKAKQHRSGAADRQRRSRAGMSRPVTRTSQAVTDLARGTGEVVPGEVVRDPGGVGGSGVDADEAELFALIARSGAAIRPESGFGRRLLALMDRQGAIRVMAKAREYAGNGVRLSDRQWVLGLEDELEAVPRRRPEASVKGGSAQDIEAAEGAFR